MASVTAQVVWATQSAEVMFGIDEPTGVAHSDASSFVVAGWVYGRNVAIGAVEIIADSDQLRWVRLQPRPDTTQHLAGLGIDSGGVNTAFYTRVSTVGLPAQSDVLVRAQNQAGETIDLVVIRVTRTPSPIEVGAACQPLLILSTGRSGSTWLMDLLRRHPEVVVHGESPYEMRPAHYWMHLVRSLSEEPAGGEPPEAFIERTAVVSPFPYAVPGTPTSDFASSPAHLRELIRYAVKSVDGFYKMIAGAQGKARARFYAEKAWFARQMPGVFNELYPGARNLFLVRDPRDAVASVLAFNRRRGWDDFGRAQMSSDEEYAAELTRYVMRGVTMSRTMPSALLIRYEDLVRSPAETLRDVLEHCGLDARPATITAVVSAAEAAGSIPADHRTTRSGPDSIGRWRGELTPSVREAIESTMGDTLRAVGYEA